jgi:hypothetical protein
MVYLSRAGPVNPTRDPRDLAEDDVLCILDEGRDRSAEGCVAQRGYMNNRLFGGTKVDIMQEQGHAAGFA